MSLAALINENKRTQSPFLDLGRCDLEYTWPEEILDFDWLEEISFAPAYYDSYENENKFTPNKGRMNKFKGNEGFERLQRLPRLRQLDFSLTEISKVDFLRSLPRLRILRLASNPISDISPVTSLKHLMYLNVLGARFKI
jgi:Leucine-rich repeat (LRR) protein